MTDILYDIVDRYRDSESLTTAMLDVAEQAFANYIVECEETRQNGLNKKSVNYDEIEMNRKLTMVWLHLIQEEQEKQNGC